MSILQWHGHFTTWPFHGDMANYHDMVILLTPVHFLVILLHSRPFVALSNSRPLVLSLFSSSSCILVLFSLGFSDSRPLEFSPSRPLLPHIVLSHWCPLVFSHSRPLVVLSDSRPSCRPLEF